jgi:hypothetical protein
VSTPSAPTSATAPTVTAVSVSGATPAVGTASQFTATAAMSSGTSQTVTSPSPIVASGGTVSHGAAASADRETTIRNYYIPGDVHFSRDGHRLVAASLLEGNGLSPGPAEAK